MSKLAPSTGNEKKVRYIVPEEYAKYVKEGAEYDEECGVMYTDIKPLTPERKQAVLRFVRENDSLFDITTMLFKKQVMYTCFYEGISTGFSREGVFVHFFRNDDPMLGEKLEKGCIFGDAHRVLHKNEEVTTLGVHEFPVNVIGVDVLRDMMFVWMECLMEGVALLQMHQY